MTISEHCCLIEYYLKFKVKNIDEYAEYYEKLRWLSAKNIIDIKLQ
jgi:phage gp36-like protein